MLTLEKLTIYKRYGGDPDGFSRGGTEQEKDLITYEEWGQIDLLLHKIGNLKAGLVSKEFEARIRAELVDEVKDEKARRFLWEMV